MWNSSPRIRLDGTAEDVPGAPTPLPPNGVDTNHVLELPASLRLSDAERIASERLDGAAEGSLKEALAILPPNAPSSAALPLADRLEAVGESQAAAPPAVSFDAKLAADASDHQPMAAQETGLLAAAPSSAVAEAAADAGLRAEATEDFHAPADDTLQVAAASPVPSAGAPESARPLASAFDAATRLAADANAAAAALGNLKRLLERQLPGVAESPAPAAAEAGIQTSASAPAAPAMPPPLPTLPLHAVRDGSGRTTLRPAVLAPPPPPRRAQPERVRFDVRGFLAGFALSWAFGVVLYLFMTAG